MANGKTNDLRTAILSNQKNVYVMNSAPTTAYDGQFWVCTSSDPPLVKVYDLTNARWMEYHALYYEAVTSGQMPAATPVTNGALAVAYDTEQSGTTLYARANGSWRDMGGALTRAYPIADVTSTVVRGPGTVNLPDGFRLESGIGSGAEYIIVSGSITPSEDGVTVVAFGGVVTKGETNKSGEVRLYLDGTEKASESIINTYETISLVGATDTMSASEYFVDLRIYSHVSGGAFHYAGGSIGSYSVKT